jgi:hypothetical protein
VTISGCVGCSCNAVVAEKATGTAAGFGTGYEGRNGKRDGQK